MPSDQNKDRDRSRLELKDLEIIFGKISGTLLPAGKEVIKLSPSINDFPIEDKRKSEKNANERLTITGTESDLKSIKIYKQRITLIHELLSGTTEINALSKRVKQLREKVSEVFQKNMETVFEKVRPIEKTYRELDAFFCEAKLSPQDGRVAGVYIVNASPSRDFNKIMNEKTGIIKYIGKGGEAKIDLRDMFGLIVVPEWVGDKAYLKQYGEMAEKAMAHLFVGFPDVATLEEAHEMFGVGEEFDGLKSTENYKRHVSMVGNPLRIRLANLYEQKNNDLYINPTLILAGKIFRGDVKEGIHVARANETYGKVELPTPDKSTLMPKWDIQNVDMDFKPFKNSVIVLAYRQGWVFWGVDTLYKWSGLKEDQGFDQYSVVRPDTYLKKVIIHFLNGEIFKQNDSTSRGDIQEKLSKFLSENTNEADASKMLNLGKVLVEKGTDDDRLKITVTVKYKQAIRDVEVEFKYHKQDGMWKQE